MDKKIGFRHVEIKRGVKDILGTGAYGNVYKAVCDNLICAAKILHLVLAQEEPGVGQEGRQLYHRRLPVVRFNRECEILSNLHHPNIVQFLGVVEDCKQPALLMELMDENLTTFLSRSKVPVPFHIQVTIIHDISLALAFLHLNNIIHRDLSSNNVLLIGNSRAKLSDFGMVKLHELSDGGSVTKVPGADVYMAPETVSSKVHTDKIDCFSLGVLTIQIVTRKYPEPTDRFHIITKEPQYNFISVPEHERRKDHLSLIDFHHPFRPIILSCIADEPANRPQATTLCDYFGHHRQSKKYEQSLQEELGVHKDLESAHAEIEILKEERKKLENKVRKTAEEEKMVFDELEKLKQDYRELEERLKVIASRKQESIELLQVRDDHNTKKDQWEKFGEEFPPGLGTKTSMYMGKNPPIGLVADGGATNQGTRSSAMLLAKKSFQWLPVPKFTPSDINKGCDAVVIGTRMYCRSSGQNFIRYYNSTDNTWSVVRSQCPTYHSTLAIFEENLVAVGGKEKGEVTNKVYVLTETESWSMDSIPLMPTRRHSAAAASTENYIIVMGGQQKQAFLKTVEILDIFTLKWSSTVDLPKPITPTSLSALVCNGNIYAIGGIDGVRDQVTSMYMCGLQQLITQRHSSITKKLKRSLSYSSLPNPWSEVMRFPVTKAAFVAVEEMNTVLFIGGMKADGEMTDEVNAYDTKSRSWELWGHLKSARCLCVAGLVTRGMGKMLIIAGSEDMSIDSFESTSDSVEMELILLGTSH